MLAIVEVKGHQYKINKNDIIITEKIDANEGDEIELDKVLLYYDNNELQIGKPYLNIKLKAKVIKHFKGDKIIVFKYTPKKRYRRKKGHRQLLTKLQII